MTQLGEAFQGFFSTILNLVPWLVALIVIMILLAIPRIQKGRHRRMLIRRLGEQRGSQVVTMIHRPGGTIPFVGGGSIGLPEAESLLKMIRQTPPDKPIDLIIHTPGGMVLATTQIARALKNHPAPVRVIVPHWAMSGGTLLSLSADEIIMDKNAVLGPVDPQTIRFPQPVPMASVLRVIKEKSKDKIDDTTWILAHQSEMAIKQIEDHITWLLTDRLGEERARELGKTFTEGRWTHDFPLTCDALAAMGLKVSTEVPQEAYDLLEAFPQGSKFRSVQWLPKKAAEKGSK